MKKQCVMRYDHTAQKLERRVGRGETVPNESLTIRQIFERFRAGGTMTAKMHESANQDEDIPDNADPEKLTDMNQARTLDLFDKEQLLETTKAERKEAEQKLSEQEKQAQKKRDEQREEYENMRKQFKEASQERAPKKPKGSGNVGGTTE